MSIRSSHLCVLPLLIVSTLGCGGSSSYTAPVAARAPSREPIPVPTLPPPALVEEMPPRPSSEMVWADGCWEPSAEAWVWIRGGWLVPPAGAALFRGSVNVTEDGGFLWYPCTWVVGQRAVGWLEPAVSATVPFSARTIYRSPL